MPNYASSPEDLLIRAEDEELMEIQERHSIKLTRDEVVVLVRLYLIGDTSEGAAKAFDTDLSHLNTIKTNAIDSLAHNKRVCGIYHSHEM